MFVSKFHWSILAVMVWLVGCHDPPDPLTAEDIARITEGKPAVLVVSGEPQRVTLEGLEAFYLGMPEDEANKAIESICKRPVELNGGVGRQDAIFKGCMTPNLDGLYAFRIGFNHTIENRVFTLEVKRKPTDLKVIRARFYERFGEVQTDLPKRGTLKMESTKYNMFADIDQGASGPTHILIGLSDASVSSLRSEVPAAKLDP